ncbi:MAG: hypothetical protein JKY23_00290 [Nitrospinaceae bacterium]|nr:hypothetical protein [Nitrospinaceae bacterium]
MQDEKGHVPVAPPDNSPIGVDAPGVNGYIGDRAFVPFAGGFFHGPLPMPNAQGIRGWKFEHASSRYIPAWGQFVTVALVTKGNEATFALLRSTSATRADVLQQAYKRGSSSVPVVSTATWAESMSVVKNRWPQARTALSQSMALATFKNSVVDIRFQVQLGAQDKQIYGGRKNPLAYQVELKDGTDADLSLVDVQLELRRPLGMNVCVSMDLTDRVIRDKEAPPAEMVNTTFESLFAVPSLRDLAKPGLGFQKKFTMFKENWYSDTGLHEQRARADRNDALPDVFVYDNPFAHVHFDNILFIEFEWPDFRSVRPVGTTSLTAKGRLDVADKKLLKEITSTTVSLNHNGIKWRPKRVWTFPWGAVMSVRNMTQRDTKEERVWMVFPTGQVVALQIDRSDVTAVHFDVFMNRLLLFNRGTQAWSGVQDFEPREVSPPNVHRSQVQSLESALWWVQTTQKDPTKFGGYHYSVPRARGLPAHGPDDSLVSLAATPRTMEVDDRFLLRDAFDDLEHRRVVVLAQPWLVDDEQNYVSGGYHISVWARALSLASRLVVEYPSTLVIIQWRNYDSSEVRNDANSSGDSVFGPAPVLQIQNYKQHGKLLTLDDLRKHRGLRVWTGLKTRVFGDDRSLVMTVESRRDATAKVRVQRAIARGSAHGFTSGKVDSNLIHFMLMGALTRMVAYGKGTSMPIQQVTAALRPLARYAVRAWMYYTMQNFVALEALSRSGPPVFYMPYHQLQAVMDKDLDTFITFVYRRVLSANPDLDHAMFPGTPITPNHTHTVKYMWEFRKNRWAFSFSAGVGNECGAAFFYLMAPRMPMHPGYTSETSTVGSLNYDKYVEDALEFRTKAAKLIGKEKRQGNRGRKQEQKRAEQAPTAGVHEPGAMENAVKGWWKKAQSWVEWALDFKSSPARTKDRIGNGKYLASIAKLRKIAKTHSGDNMQPVLEYLGPELKKQKWSRYTHFVQGGGQAWNTWMKQMMKVTGDAMGEDAAKEAFVAMRDAVETKGSTKGSFILTLFVELINRTSGSMSIAEKARFGAATLSVSKYFAEKVRAVRWDVFKRFMIEKDMLEKYPLRAASRDVTGALKNQKARDFLDVVWGTFMNEWGTILEEKGLGNNSPSADDAGGAGAYAADDEDPSWDMNNDPDATESDGDEFDLTMNQGGAQEDEKKVEEAVAEVVEAQKEPEVQEFKRKRVHIEVEEEASQEEVEEDDPPLSEKEQQEQEREEAKSTLEDMIGEQKYSHGMDQDVEAGLYESSGPVDMVDVVEEAAQAKQASQSTKNQVSRGVSDFVNRLVRDTTRARTAAKRFASFGTSKFFWLQAAKVVGETRVAHEDTIVRVFFEHGTFLKRPDHLPLPWWGAFMADMHQRYPNGWRAMVERANPSDMGPRSQDSEGDIGRAVDRDRAILTRKRQRESESESRSESTVLRTPASTQPSPGRSATTVNLDSDSDSDTELEETQQDDDMKVASVLSASSSAESPALVLTMKRGPPVHVKSLRERVAEEKTVSTTDSDRSGRGGKRHRSKAYDATQGLEKALDYSAKIKAQASALNHDIRMIERSYPKFAAGLISEAFLEIDDARGMVNVALEAARFWFDVTHPVAGFGTVAVSDEARAAKIKVQQDEYLVRYRDQTNNLDDLLANIAGISMNRDVPIQMYNAHSASIVAYSSFIGSRPNSRQHPMVYGPALPAHDQPWPTVRMDRKYAFDGGPAPGILSDKGETFDHQGDSSTQDVVESIVHQHRGTLFYSPAILMGGNVCRIAVTRINDPKWDTIVNYVMVYTMLFVVAMKPARFMRTWAALVQARLDEEARTRFAPSGHTLDDVDTLIMFSVLPPDQARKLVTSAMKRGAKFLYVSSLKMITQHGLWARARAAQSQDKMMDMFKHAITANPSMRGFIALYRIVSMWAGDSKFHAGDLLIQARNEIMASSTMWGRFDAFKAHVRKNMKPFITRSRNLLSFMSKILPHELVRGSRVMPSFAPAPDRCVTSDLIKHSYAQLSLLVAGPGPGRKYKVDTLQMPTRMEALDLMRMFPCRAANAQTAMQVYHSMLLGFVSVSHSKGLYGNKKLLKSLTGEMPDFTIDVPPPKEMLRRAKLKSVEKITVPTSYAMFNTELPSLMYIYWDYLDLHKKVPWQFLFPVLERYTSLIRVPSHTAAVANRAAQWFVGRAYRPKHVASEYVDEKNHIPEPLPPPREVFLWTVRMMVSASKHADSGGRRYNTAHWTYDPRAHWLAQTTVVNPSAKELAKEKLAVSLAMKTLLPALDTDQERKNRVVAIANAFGTSPSDADHYLPLVGGRCHQLPTGDVFLGNRLSLRQIAPHYFRNMPDDEEAFTHQRRYTLPDPVQKLDAPMRAEQTVGWSEAPSEPSSKIYKAWREAHSKKVGLFPKILQKSTPFEKVDPAESNVWAHPENFYLPRDAANAEDVHHFKLFWRMTMDGLIQIISQEEVDGLPLTSPMNYNADPEVQQVVSTPALTHAYVVTVPDVFDLDDPTHLGVKVYPEAYLLVQGRALRLLELYMERSAVQPMRASQSGANNFDDEYMHDLMPDVHRDELFHVALPVVVDPQPEEKPYGPAFAAPVAPMSSVFAELERKGPSPSEFPDASGVLNWPPVVPPHESPLRVVPESPFDPNVVAEDEEEDEFQPFDEDADVEMNILGAKFSAVRLNYQQEMDKLATPLIRVMSAAQKIYMDTLPDDYVTFALDTWMRSDLKELRERKCEQYFGVRLAPRV